MSPKGRGFQSQKWNIVTFLSPTRLDRAWLRVKYQGFPNPKTQLVQPLCGLVALSPLVESGPFRDPRPWPIFNLGFADGRTSETDDSRAVASRKTKSRAVAGRSQGGSDILRHPPCIVCSMFFSWKTAMFPWRIQMLKRSKRIRKSCESKWYPRNYQPFVGP